MSDLRVSVLSTVYVKIPVTPRKNGAVVDPSGDAVEMAFVATDATPISGDWKTASWETISGQVYARCLIGPVSPGVAYAIGTYAQWIRVHDSPEVPVMFAANNLVIF